MVEKELKVVLCRRKAGSGEVEVLEKELTEVSYGDELRIGNVTILVDGFGRLCILSDHGQILIDREETLLEDGTFVVPSYSGSRVRYEQEFEGVTL
jgi:hypothetical protein